jgi:hypothetical protein
MSPVNSSLGIAGTPPATRAGTHGWRDPRMWIGIAIVAVSVVAGVRLVGGADDTISVWAVTEDLGAGGSVDPDMLEARAVRFADAADAARYLRVDEPLPAGRFLTRGVGAGELLPLAALGEAGRAGVVQVPIRVPVDGVPPSVVVGSHVDVYVSDDAEASRPAVLLLGDVAVTGAPGPSDELGATGDRQLVLGVPEDEDDALARLIAASAAGTLTVVGRS